MLEKQRQVKRIEKNHWAALETEPGDKLAEPHSADWNTANFLNYRNQGHIKLLRRRDGKPLDDRPAGREDIFYTVSPQPLGDGLDLDQPFRFLLIDLGMACSFADCEEQPAPGGVPDFMSPEYALKLPTTFKGDIYSLGLLFWKIVMLRNLVEKDFVFDKASKYPRDRRLRDLAQRLGPVPLALRNQWEGADEFVDAEGNALMKFMEWDGEEYGPDEFAYGDIWHQARTRKPLDMSKDELGVFVSLMKEMLQWTPESRPSTSDLIRQEWFADLRKASEDVE